jgi:hypothetical protein
MIDVVLYVLVGLGIVAGIHALYRPVDAEPRISRRALRRLEEQERDEET